jgi:hypothetical protein
MPVVIVGKPKNLRNCWIREVNLKHGRLVVVTTKLSECKLRYFTKGSAAVALKKKFFGDGGWAGGRRGRFDFWSTQPLQPSQFLDFPTWENGLFKKGFSRHGELKNRLEHEVYIHFVIHKCLVAGRWYGPNIERNFPLIT